MLWVLIRIASTLMRPKKKKKVVFTVSFCCFISINFVFIKGKRKLKLLITCENFVLFVNIFLENVAKKVNSRGVVLERASRVTVNLTFFFHLSNYNIYFNGEL